MDMKEAIEILDGIKITGIRSKYYLEGDEELHKKVEALKMGIEALREQKVTER